MRGASLVLGALLATGCLYACAEGGTRRPSHVATNDCNGAKRPRLPDGKSALVCEEDASGFHWTLSQAPEDHRRCENAPVLLLACTHGQRGLVCMRSPAGDGGSASSEWLPICN